MTEQLHFHSLLSCIGEGNGNPLQCSCLENPRDRGAWWATVYGVAQSQTRLKRLSSSSSSFLVVSLGFSMLSCHLRSQFYFFSNLNSFYFFSSVISVARTSKTMFNKSDKHGPSCLVPDLILEKVLSAF